MREKEKNATCLKALFFKYNDHRILALDYPLFAMLIQLSKFIFYAFTQNNVEMNKPIQMCVHDINIV